MAADLTSRFDADVLRDWPVVEKSFRWPDSSTMLYALAVGVGTDPTDEKQLQYVCEQGLETLPTMATVMGSSFPWLRDPATGIDLRTMVHVDAGVRLHRRVPPVGDFTTRVKIDDLLDQGPGKAAIIRFSQRLYESESDTQLATVNGGFMLRGQGGFGGRSFSRPPSIQVVDGAPPDVSAEFALPANAGLLYRLTGDRNPLHASPAFARAAGFERPILHGYCTFGVAGHVLVRAICGYRPDAVSAIHVRFTAPVYPGEHLRVDAWKRDSSWVFRCTALERAKLVLDDGILELHA